MYEIWSDILQWIEVLINIYIYFFLAVAIDLPVDPQF